MPGGVLTSGTCLGLLGVPVDLLPQGASCMTLRSNSSPMTLRDGKGALDYVDVQVARAFSETWTVDRGKLVRLTAPRG